MSQRCTTEIPCPVCAHVHKDYPIRKPKILTPYIVTLDCVNCKSRFIIQLVLSRKSVGQIEFKVLDGKLSRQGQEYFESLKTKTPATPEKEPT